MAALELASTPLFTDSNLVAYYKLEDTADSKGSNTLTNNNSVTFTSTKFNNGGNFGTANTNKSLSVASTLGLSSSGSKSIVGWAKMNTELSGADSFGDFISLSHADIDIVWRIGYWRESSVNEFVVNRGKNGIGTTGIKYSTNLGTSTIHAIGMSWDGTTLTSYLDGVSVGTETPSGNGNNGFSDEFRIGADNAGTNFISANVDDVGVFSRKLTATEFASHFSGDFPSGNFFRLF